MNTLLILFYMLTMFAIGVIIGWYHGKRGK